MRRWQNEGEGQRRREEERQRNVAAAEAAAEEHRRQVQQQQEELKRAISGANRLGLSSNEYNRHKSSH